MASVYTGLAAEDTIPNFSGTPLSGVAPLTVHFNQIGNESSTTIRWDLGDGTYSTTKNPTHTYNKTGTYTVKLTVDNQIETKSNYIVVTSPPIPPVSAFSASPISGNAPLTVTLCDEKLYYSATRSYKSYCIDAIPSVWDNPTKTCVDGNVNV